MSTPDFVAVAASINQRLAQIEAAQTAAHGAITAATVTAVVAAVAALLSLGGVILTAWVARRNGFIQTRATQQLKHADFRQAWINGLREEMARYLSRTAEYVADRANEPKVIESMAMILLRMNSRDKEYDGLVVALDEVLDAAQGRLVGKTYGEAAGDYLIICQRILKCEWETTRIAMLEEPPMWGSDIRKEPDPSAPKVRMPRHLDTNGVSLAPSDSSTADVRPSTKKQRVGTAKPKTQPPRNRHSSS